MKKIASKTYRKLFIIFFIIMLLLTFLSKILDSILVPKIQIKAFTAGNLSYIVEGEGIIKSATTKYVTIPSGIFVDQVRTIGEKVVKGDCLIYLRLSDLENKKREIQRELTKMLLALDKEKLSSKPASRVSESEKAAWEVVVSEKKLNEALTKLQKAQEEYTHGLINLNTKRERDKHFAGQQLALSKEDIDLINQEQNASVSGNFVKKNSSQAELSYQIEIARIDEAYLSSLQQLDAKQKDASSKANELQDSHNRLLYNSSLADKSEESIRKNEQIAANISAKSQKILQLDIDSKKEELQKIEDLLTANGQVESMYDGFITKMEVTPGAMTSGQEIVAVSGGDFLFSGHLSKDGAGLLAEGDKLEVSAFTEAKKVSATISTITMNSDETSSNDETYALFTALLSKGNYRVGSSANYKITKSSAIKYSCLIPIEALREDGQGSFCLIAENNSTILGEETIAARINLEVLAKNDTHAAVGNVLTESDRIIIGSNKSIKEGDRVRIE